MRPVLIRCAFCKKKKKTCCDAISGGVDDSACRELFVFYLRVISEVLYLKLLSSPLCWPLLVCFQYKLLNTWTLKYTLQPRLESANEMLTESEISGLTCTKVACVRRDRYSSHWAGQQINRAETETHLSESCRDQTKLLDAVTSQSKSMKPSLWISAWRPPKITKLMCFT